ncbi:MAG TPA: hypothetical protein VGK92_04825 [Gaiellales bacterium]
MLGQTPVVDAEVELDGVVDGVVEGAVDGVELSPPMFGQSPAWCVAVPESFATAAAGVVVGVVLDELDAACATAPPASAAVAARITISLR